jgi:hypothetical protein
MISCKSEKRDVYFSGTRVQSKNHYIFELSWRFPRPTLIVILVKWAAEQTI